MSVTILDVVHALVFIFPAYCANGAPVIFGGGRSLDGGRSFLDGKPILGSHKTIRGFFGGLVIGTLVGFVQYFLFEASHRFPSLSVIAFSPSLLLGFVLSLGALIAAIYAFGKIQSTMSIHPLNSKVLSPIPDRGLV